MSRGREAGVPREFASDGRLVILPEAPAGMPVYAHMVPLVDVLSKRPDLSVPPRYHYFSETDLDGRGGVVWDCRIGYPIDWVWANRVAQIPDTIRYIPCPRLDAMDAVRYEGPHGRWCTVFSAERADSPRWVQRGWVTGEPFQPPSRPRTVRSFGGRRASRRASEK